MTRTRRISPRKWSIPYLAVAASTLSDMKRALDNKDIPELSLLAISLQDTSNAVGVAEVRKSCARLREVIRVWDGTESKAAVGAIDGIIAAHGRLRSDFAIAQSWLTRYVETGKVPDDGVSARSVGDRWRRSLAKARGAWMLTAPGNGVQAS
ncbi:hypothetical protein F5148DRAFT_508974 [Russula earlei]|uniref:Uncharacterized protein n=1 Tax=Russula earlei TaxID=71964 RepID=A0ACC0UI44_9AGAM|nr:hypothetical protein F5148DRAFT_508974 [Russula earlei]